MTDPDPIPSPALTPLPGDSQPEEPAVAQPGTAATPLADRRRRRGRRSPEGRQSAKALAARRANIAKARAVARGYVYRPTARRQAASRANIQKAIAWRRSQKGNAIARRNALLHGLAVKKLPELLVPLGEGPQDLEKHRAMVERVFQPATEIEWDLVERLAQATWRRMRIYRALARLEVLMWRRLLARAGPERRLSCDETSERARVISKQLDRAFLLEDQANVLENRIERLLNALISERAREEAAGVEEESGSSEERAEGGECGG